MSIEYTEHAFEADCEARGYKPLPDLYTESHLFFCNDPAEGERLVKVARKGITELEARVRFARTTARKHHSSVGIGTGAETSRPQALPTSRPQALPRNALPTSAAAELKMQLRAANERLKEQEEVRGALKPSNPQTLKPSNPQTLKPSNPQTLTGETLKPSNPQTLKPSSSQALKHSLLN